MTRGILLNFCLMLGWLATAKAAEGGKRVLIVHSYGSATAMSQSVAFETELTKLRGSEKVYVDEVYLEHARYPETDMEEALLDYLQKRVAKWQPDLVVPLVSPACVFVAKHRERLFPGTPILYAGMDKRRLPAGALEKNATFVGKSFNLPGFAEDMLQLAPDTTNIVCVIGASPVERYWTTEFQSEFARFTNRVSFTWLNDLPFDQMLERVKRLPPRSFVFVILMLRDAAGVAHDSEDVLKQIREAANAPVNGIFENQVGLGIVGGRLYSHQAEGVAAARIAFRILRGEPASSFPPVIMESVGPRYDWRELKRWRIPERSLSPGSIVQFREPTIWQRYRGWIMGGVSALVVQGAIIGSLVLNRMKRRRAEAALERSEHEARSQLGQLSSIYDSAPTGLTFLDTDLRYVRINDHLAEINRLPASEHIGRTVRQVLGALADQIEPLCRRVIDQGQSIRDVEIRGRDSPSKAERVWLVSYHPVKDERGSVLGVGAIVQEITARKRAEETLRNIAAGVSAKTGETFFHSLAEHISRVLEVEFTYVCEVQEGGQFARTVAAYVDGTATENVHYELAGTPCEEVLRLGTAVYPQEIQQSFPKDAMLREIGAEGYLGVCLKGSSGKALGLLVVMSRKPLVNVEATKSMLEIFAARASAELERKQAEQDLRESEERYREVVESQTDLVCRFRADGTLTFVNVAYSRFYGCARDRMIGRKFYEFLPENVHAAAMEFVALLTRERRPLTAEHQVILPDGTIGWQHWVDYPIVGPDGEVIEFQGIGRDITDRKRAEEANFKLTHATRLAMVGELTGMVIHDLSQPLSATLCNVRAAELMLQHGNPPTVKEIPAILGSIRHDTQRASETVSRMRTLLRQRKLELRPLDFGELVAEVVNIVGGEAARRRIQIKTELDAEFPPINGDGTHLQQVLLNLILNGMDAMANTPESRRRLLIRTGENADGIEVAISDTGHGIPVERLPRVFDSFFTTKEQGLGLGLSIAKWIIEAHSGKIHAENDSNGGATFRFTLPTNKAVSDPDIIGIRCRRS